MPEFLTLRTAEEAWEIFRVRLRPPSVRSCARLPRRSTGCWPRAGSAPDALPTFVRSTVDGYAVQAADTHGASVGLPAYLDVVAEVAMGSQADFVLGRGQAALVHTGGMAPAGADAVVMLEHTSPPGPRRRRRRAAVGFATYCIEVTRPAAAGDGCIQPGEDVAAGDLILPAGHTLRPQDLGGLLAVGVTQVQVARRPVVGIVSQGDEVVPPEQTPGPGQVRDINSYTLAAYVRRAVASPSLSPSRPIARRRWTRSRGPPSSRLTWWCSPPAAPSAIVT